MLELKLNVVMRVAHLGNRMCSNVAFGRNAGNSSDIKFDAAANQEDDVRDHDSEPSCETAPEGLPSLKCSCGFAPSPCPLADSSPSEKRGDCRDASGTGDNGKTASSALT